jgi:hypothetical protein
MSPKLLIILGSSLLAITALSQVGPQWWPQRGVFKPGATPDDYAALNQGQLKNLASATIVEMNARLPGGAGTQLNQLKGSWTTTSLAGVNRDDFQVVTVGQLKSLGALFYARFDQVRAGIVPGWQQVLPNWQFHSDPASNLDDNQDEIVNIGQAKELFAALEGNRQSQTFPNTWDSSQLWDPHTGTGIDGSQFLFGLDWFVDSDGDGYSDLQSVLEGFDPNNVSVQPLMIIFNKLR